jgi:hypothetical protein
MNDDMQVTVTLTAEDLAFYDQAKEAGIPSMLVSMYSGALKRLVASAVEAERQKSLQLWMLLDDVDTADDIAKADDAVYRSLCRQANIKRWSVLNGDEVDAAIRARGEK